MTAATELREPNKPIAVQTEYIEQVLHHKDKDLVAFDPRLEIGGSHHKKHAERRLAWKADLLILPLAAMVFLIAYMDRSNIGNARVAGMQKALNMTDHQYFICLTMFFVGYCALMLPSNLLIRIVGCNNQIGAACVSFGVCVCCLAAAPNWQTVAAIRVLIGLTDALISGLWMYSSVWYKRDEAATRASIYYFFATMAGGLTGLISYGVQKDLDGKSHHSAWQWIYIIEGVVGIFVGILVWVFLPPFPDQIKGKHWLFTEEEIQLAVTYNTPGFKVHPKQVLVAMKDPKTWMFAIMNGGIGLSVGSVGSFLPTFINEFGYSTLRTQLFTIIPYACAAVTMVVLNMWSDRLNKKGVFLMGTLTAAIIGYVILIAVTNNKVRIFGTCLIAVGAYPSVTLFVVWISNNTGGYTKRSTVWAIAEIFAQGYSIFGTQIYTTPPRFIKGHSVLLAMSALSLIMVFMVYIMMDRSNKRKDWIILEYENHTGAAQLSAGSYKTVLYPNTA
ncbi:hypothetical protein B7463_g10286, partial [Scytalidium lignicola]